MPDTAVSRTLEERDRSFQYLNFTYNLAAFGNADVLTDYPLDFYGEIVEWRIAVGTPATGAGATITLNLEINAVAVTGEERIFTLANGATLGTVFTMTPTGANIFNPDDTLSIIGTTSTVFTAGTIIITIVLRPLS